MGENSTEFLLYIAEDGLGAASTVTDCLTVQIGRL